MTPEKLEAWEHRVFTSGSPERLQMLCPCCDVPYGAGHHAGCPIGEVARFATRLAAKMREPDGEFFTLVQEPVWRSYIYLDSLEGDDG